MTRKSITNRRKKEKLKMGRVMYPGMWLLSRWDLSHYLTICLEMRQWDIILEGFHGKHESLVPLGLYRKISKIETSRKRCGIET